MADLDGDHVIVIHVGQMKGSCDPDDAHMMAVPVDGRKVYAWVKAFRDR